MITTLISNGLEALGVMDGLVSLSGDRYCEIGIRKLCNYVEIRPPPPHASNPSVIGLAGITRCHGVRSSSIGTNPTHLAAEIGGTHRDD